MKSNTTFTMIEGAQKNFIFQFPNSISIAQYDVSVEIRSPVTNRLILEFSTVDNTLNIAGNNVLLFIPASKTRDIIGNFKAQLGYWKRPDDLIKLPYFNLNIEKAVLIDDQQPDGNSVFDAILADNVIIEVTTPSVATIQMKEFAIFQDGSSSSSGGLNYQIISFGSALLDPDVGVYATEEDGTVNIIIDDYIGSARAYIFKVNNNATIRFIKSVEQPGGGSQYQEVLVLAENDVYLVCLNEDGSLTSDILTGEGGGSGGADGWTPIFELHTDGQRNVLEIADWTGGAGTKPATGYLADDGSLVSDIAEGADIRGMQGTPGEDGEPGEPGEDGQPGLSAYQIAVENGFSGTEEEWLNSLKAINSAYPVTRSYSGVSSETIIPYDAIDVYPDYVEPASAILEAVFFRSDGFFVKTIDYKIFDNNSIQVFLDSGFTFTGTITIRLLPSPV